jgi:hypothetical protein
MFNLKKRIEEKRKADSDLPHQLESPLKQVAVADLILRKGVALTSTFRKKSMIFTVSVFVVFFSDLARIEFSESLVKLDFPNSDDLRHFSVVVKPDSGIWAGGSFKFMFDIPRYLRSGSGCNLHTFDVRVCM